MNDIEKLFYDIEKLMKRHLKELINHPWFDSQHALSLTDASNIKVREKDNKVLVNIAIPGLTKDHQLDINVINNHLVVQGTISKINEVNSANNQRYRESYSEYFYKTIPLPYKVEARGSKASYHNNVLQISLNKIGELDSGHIPIDFNKY